MAIEAEVFSLKVPSTTANLGPGFDSLGLALKEHNQWTVEVLKSEGEPELKMTKCAGAGCDTLPTNEDHLFFSSWIKLHDLGLGPDLVGLLKENNYSVYLQANNATPLARGLGSSAALRVASAATYQRLCGLTGKHPWQLAASLEGHPDNAAPAGLGGLVASLCDSDTNRWQAINLDIHECWQVLAIVPDFKLLTEEARSVLPANYKKEDAYFNLARIPFLLQGLAQGNSSLVQMGCQDRLHQPQRSSLVPGFYRAQKAGLKAGAAAVFLSGAGPSLAAFVDKRNFSADAVAKTLAQALSLAGIEVSIKILEVDRQGLQITKH